jgi:CelD/BcsL family acetyltransferase involved in cellulose biosynthesis
MRIERFKDDQRFNQIRDEWNKALFASEQSCLFLTHQWFAAWWQSFGQTYEMEILVFTGDDGAFIGAAPLMLDGQSLRFMASHEVTDYCDFFFRRDYDSGFYKVLLGCLQAQFSAQTEMTFINIPASSITLLEIPRLAPEYGFEAKVMESEVVPLLSLPSSYEAYLNSLNRKHRHELRRKLRRMESLDRVQIINIKDPEEIESAIDAFISLHKEGSPDKKVFWEKKGMRDFFTTLTRQYSQQGWAKLSLLLTGNEMLAALLSFCFSDTLYFYNVAYNREYSSYSPGVFLFDQSIKQAISEGKKTADFLRGGERYKYYLGAKDSKIYNLVLKNKEKVK